MGKFGELTQDQCSRVRECAMVFLEARFKTHGQSARQRLVTVADVKSRIAEYVSEGASCGCGLHLDGTLEALEDEVKRDAGAQDDATQSRWRQWIVEEALQQD